MKLSSLFLQMVVPLGLMTVALSGCQADDEFDSELQSRSIVEERPGTGLPVTPVGDCREGTRAVVANVFKLPENTSALPDLNRLVPLKQICLSNIDVADRDYQLGFPGLPELTEWFALDLKFQVLVQNPGVYSFKLASDDGSRLWINNRELVNNDGVHSVKELQGDVYLNPGVYPVRIAYFQGPRVRIALQLSWKTPLDGNFAILPASSIVPAGIPTLPIPN